VYPASTAARLAPTAALAPAARSRIMETPCWARQISCCFSSAISDGGVSLGLLAPPRPPETITAASVRLTPPPEALYSTTSVFASEAPSKRVIVPLLPADSSGFGKARLRSENVGAGLEADLLGEQLAP